MGDATSFPESKGMSATEFIKGIQGIRDAANPYYKKADGGGKIIEKSVSTKIQPVFY